MNRILAVVRLQALGRRDGFLWPIVILGIAFAVNILIFGSFGDDMGHSPVTGGLSSIYITALAFGAVAISQQFPFALGMSVTRREFSVALGLFILGQSLVYSVLLAILHAVEVATGGWGMRLWFFGFGVLDDQNVAVQLAAYAVPMMLMSLIGVVFGTVFIRWKTNGVFTVVGLLILLLGGAVALLTRFGWWPAVGDWLGGQNVLTLFAGWPLLVVAVLALVSFSTLRRATA